MFKRVPVGIELEITQLLSSPGLRLEPHNHCVPLLEVIDLPNALDQKLMVMPFLRPFNKPRFQTFGEFVSFFIQICDVRPAQLPVRGHRWDLTIINPGSSVHARTKYRTQVRSFFLLENAYRGHTLRDCTPNNIMLDPSGMYPNGFHPIHIKRNQNFKGRAKRFTRTQRPTRYYLIDFGLSRRYKSRDALDEPLRGGDKSAPEHLLGRQCNPFQTDIYYLGNLVREYFLKVISPKCRLDAWLT
jgi:hypothetical protein